MKRAWKILVVDDDAAFRSALLYGLALDQHEVMVAANADEALALSEQRGFDVALVDLMMPGHHGLELARDLQQRWPKVHVVLTSAFHLSTQQLAHADCGAVGFLAKPYTTDRLLQYLDARLSGAALVA